jgi:hypothetical protein
MWVLVKVMVMDGIGSLEITQQLRSMLATDHQHSFRASSIRDISIGSVFDAAKKRNPNVISSSMLGILNASRKRSASARIPM